MPNVQTNYRFYFYSKDQRVQRLQKGGLPESKVLDTVTALKELWDNEPGEERGSIVIDEVENTRSSFANDLLNQDAVYVLAEHKVSGEMVGFGQMVKAPGNGGLLSYAYVLPEHRRKGILGGITRKIIEAARTKGYQTLTADTASDGRAQSVLEGMGFTILSENDEGDVKLGLSLRGYGEGNGQTPGTTDRSRR